MRPWILVAVFLAGCLTASEDPSSDVGAASSEPTAPEEGLQQDRASPLDEKPPAAELDASALSDAAAEASPEAEASDGAALDQARIVFAMTGAPFDLYTLRSDGTDLRPVLDPSLVPALEGRSQAFPRWSPDRRRLAFVAGGELFVADADGANVRSLASSVHRAPPSWRPDGQSLVFLAGNVVQEVTMAGELRPAAGFSPWQYNVEPVVLPSGGLVYQGYCNEEACASHGGTFGLPGCEDGAAIYGHGFAFAKDGASLLYAQQADPRAWSPFDFEQRGAVGKCEACACTTVLSMGDAWLPRWSPDDRGFVFLRGDRQMWIVREGAEPTLLFEGAGPLTGLDW